MGDLSPHFSRHEFACKHCQQQMRPPSRLVATLERIRKLTGEPLVIVSGYRCLVHNVAVGGARGSQHLYGNAADIPRGRATEDQARAAGARGIGLSGDWAIHVDVRPGTPAVWRY